MTIEENLRVDQLYDRDGERYLIKNKVIILATHKENEPDGTQHHSYICAKSDKSSKYGPRETVPSYLDIKLLAFLEAPVRIEMRSIDLYFVVSGFQSEGHINNKIFSSSNSEIWM